MVTLLRLLLLLLLRLRLLLLLMMMMICLLLMMMLVSLLLNTRRFGWWFVPTTHADARIIRRAACFTIQMMHCLSEALEGLIRQRQRIAVWMKEKRQLSERFSDG